MSKLVNLTMFRGYVNKVLPTVYDDSLSYYEVLAKVMEKINEIINLDNAQNEIINNIPEDVSEFAEDLAQFKSSMTQQFNDFKTEINADFDAFEAEVNAKVAADTTPTEGSTKLVTSGGVYASLQDIINSLVKDARPTEDSTNYVTSGGVWKAIDDAVEDLEATIATKQNTLTWDTTPTANSTNPVQSGGIKTYVDNAAQGVQNNLDGYITTNNNRVSEIEGDITALETGKQDALTFDLAPTLGSNNPVTSNGIAQAIAGVTPSIEVDPVPTSGSTNAVSSNGVYVALSDLETDLEEGLADKQDTLTFDVLPTQNSLNPVTSGGVWSAIAQVDPTGTIDPEPTQGSTAAVSSGGTWTAINNLDNELTASIGTKQDALTFDNAPTINSGNPVTSDGIYRALQEKQSTLTFDNTPTQNSTNPVTSGGVWSAIQGGGGGGTIDPTPTENSTNAVQSGGVWTALQGKQDTLTFDQTPTQNSTNPVTSGGVWSAIQGGGGGTIDPTPTQNSTNAVQSGGVWTALQGKQDTLTFDQTPTQNSTNPVTSGGVWSAIQGGGGGGSSWVTSIPQMHRNIFRGQSLGSTITATQLSEIENGTFDEIYVGDYWATSFTYGGNTFNVNWRIWDIDYYMGKGSVPVTAHHVVIIPDCALTESQLATSATDNYYNSLVYATVLPQLLSAIETQFTDKIITFYDVFGRDITTIQNLPRKIEIPTSFMMLGTTIMSDNTNPIANRTNFYNTMALTQLNSGYIPYVPNPYTSVSIDAYWSRTNNFNSNHWVTISTRAGADTSNATYAVRPCFLVGVEPT